MRCEVWARLHPTVINKVVVNDPVVVNKVVVNRKGDRHKPRLEYMREYMRSRRAQKVRKD
jgi:hypothetical protein